MVTPECFIDSAVELLEKDLVLEIDVRNAISRAYYGAFHKAFQDIGNAPEGHAELVRFLQGSKDKNMKAIAVKLKQLRNARVTADYHLDISVFDVTAKANIRSAQDFIKMVERAKKNGV